MLACRSFFCGMSTSSSDIDKNLAEGHCLMYRLYNPNTGEHFYTGSKREGNKLVDVGWNYEGIAWYGY